MRILLEKIESLKKDDISKLINKRLNEFSNLNKKNNDEWFSELCFCILTANSKAKTAIQIQEELGFNGFYNLSENELSNIIKKNKHRFHNVKAKYIIEARKYFNIKDIILKEKEPREWIANNIKGISYKEASHFLRNVGYINYAILDRHIINLMFDEYLIKEKPKTLTRDKYLKIENKLNKIANKLNMNLAELDLYLWHIKTGEVLK